MLETTAHLFPVRGKIIVCHKTIVDWLTGEITKGSSIREPSAVFKVQRKDGHAMLAEGFIAWSTATPSEGRAPDDVATKVAKDNLELRGFDVVVLIDATEMRQFVGKYMDVLQRDKGAAVMQALAQRQPDAIAVFRAASQNQPTRALKRRNISQQKDGCVGTLSLKEAVGSVAVGSTRIVSGSGNSILRVRHCSRAQVGLLASPSGTAAEWW